MPAFALLNGIDAFLLIFVRMTGLFVIAPVFGRRNIPAYLKIGFSFLLAIILVNTIKISDLDYSDSIYQYAAIVIKEFIVGITIGYVSYLAFTAVYIAGQLIDMQVGFGVVNIIDPISNIQVPITANLYFIVSMMIFLVSNEHHILIKALFDSYTHIPLGGAVFNSGLMDDIIRAFTNIFIMGFRISAPVIAAILIADIALGVISKTIPQLNVFIVGMPLKILLGVVVMFITLPMFIILIDTVINGMNGDIYIFIKDMVKK